ncbi:MAG: magnesium transporter CorA family protein [candidate division WOR-3 bacterium]
MLKRFDIVNNKIAETEKEKAPIYYFINPDDEEKRVLVENYKIDEHTLNSALDPNELARLEFEPEHIAIILKRPKKYEARDQLLFKVPTIGIFLFKNFMIIVSSEDITLFDGKLFANVSDLQELLLKMIYRSIHHFVDHLKVINLITDELEQKINRSMENRYLISMFTLEKSLVYYLDAIHSNSMLIEKLKHNASKFEFSQDLLELLDDITIENNQCYEQAQNYSEILASLMDARASIVSNNLNILIKVLNIITILLMVPTMVVSIFSMNVPLPLQGHPYAFWIILGLSGFSVLTVIFIWWRLKL